MQKAREGGLHFDGVLAGGGGEVFFKDTKALQITEMFGHSCLGCTTPPYCQLSSVYHEYTLPCRSRVASGRCTACDERRCRGR